MKSGDEALTKTYEIGGAVDSILDTGLGSDSWLLSGRSVDLHAQDSASRVTGVRVQSAKEWRRLSRRAGAVFDLKRRLPASVSSLPIPDTPFFDGDVLFGELGWSMVASLAASHGDPDVDVLVVEPDADDFMQSIRAYGGFSCPSDANVDCYLPGLFGEAGESAAGQIGYAAQAMVVVGSSGSWGIWVERNIAGIVVGSTPSIVDEWQLEHGPFLDLDDALDGFLGLNIGESAPGSDFARTLRRNYGGFRDGRPIGR